MSSLSTQTSDHRSHTEADRVAHEAVREIGVTIIVPCFNEESGCENFHANVVRLRKHLDQKYNLMLVLVDDGSSDGTLNKLKELFGNDRSCTIVSHGENRGVGAAIMTGIQHASTEIVCSMDFDCSYDPQQFTQMIPLLGDDVDIVTASPYHPDGLVRNVPKWRLALSKAASVMYGCLLDSKLFTYTSCFRVYRRRSVANIKLSNDGFVGVVELLWEVDRSGGKIVECPATLGVREYGQSKMRTMQVMFGHLGLMWNGLLRRLR